jgi:putative MATE family efflux protein
MDISKIFKERDPTQGSIAKNILSMTWPLWFNSGVWIIFYGLNIYWVSKVGTEAIAAVISGGTAFMLLMAPVQGLVTASYGLIGNLIGSRRLVEAEKMAKKILTTTWFFSLALAFTGCFFASDLLKIIGVKENVLESAAVYLRIQAIFGIVSFSLWVENGIFRASGDMMRPMVAMFSVIVLNGIFDWLFILGNLGFPRLEVAGAALASAGSAAIGAIFSFALLAKGKSIIRIHLNKWRDFKITLEDLKNIFRIAGFDSFDLFDRAAIEFIFLRCVAFWGTAALAVYGIGQRLFKMSSMAGIDLGVTVASMVSNNLGAKNLKRAKKSACLATGFNILIMGFIALLFFIFAEEIMSFYSQDAEVIRLGVSYLKITVLGYVFIAATTVLRKAFAGAKDTKTPAIVTFLAWGIVQISLANYLPEFFGLGVLGIWLAILIATVINGFVLAALFKVKFNQLKKTI